MAVERSTRKAIKSRPKKLAASNIFDAAMPERRAAISAETSRQLVHELRLKQIELLTQNEELRRTQTELNIARTKYLELYELAPVGYCTVGETEHILEANLTTAGLLDVPRSQLVGQTIQKFISPNDQDIYYLYRKRLEKTGLPQSCEVRLLRAGGAPFWAQLTSTLDLGHNGTRIHRLVLVDVNERKVAQERIRVSDVALKTVSQGILITTPELRIISANQAFVAMSGYSETELVGVNCVIFNGPRTDAGMLASLVRAIHEHGEFSGEMLYYRKDGSSFWNQLAISGIHDDKGRLTNFISVNTDITDRKNLMQALQSKNLELQSATMSAEKANRAKSDFLSNMSHELRSPLNSILGFAQLLEAGTPTLTALQQRNMDNILRGGWYLLTLINEILDLALIESGKLALSLEHLSLSQVLLDCQGMIEPLAEARQIKVNFPKFTSPLLIVADPIRLKQVIVNLLSNAVKYNRTGGTVDVKVNSDNEGTMRISVRDTGEGLPPEKLAQLFQPFNRLGQEGGTTEGTGIGLVVTRRLTELMGGRIGVQSTVGVGSTFWVELSAANELPAANDIQRDVADCPSQALANGTACTILYVEDNMANVELVEQILADRAQVKLLRAQDGMQGIEMARAHIPDVILMDINLPGLSGLDALHVLRQDPATRHIPVLAISANAMPLDIAQGLAAGFFRYLTKPFKIHQFLEVLDLALVAALNGPHTTNE